MAITMGVLESASFLKGGKTAIDGILIFAV
jgi:hypothetical protein